MNRPTTSSRRSTLPLLDNDLLRTFVAIAESGSFSRAARQVSRTPGAVSMQVRRLEETLERTLFLREARQVRLTREGQALLGYARRILEINEEAVARFLAPQVDGTVRLGVTDDVGTRILPEVLARFARTHPAVQVDVMVGRSQDLPPRLEAGELDLALVSTDDVVTDKGRGQVVYTEQLVWAGVEGGTAAARRPLPLALAAEGCCWRAKALSALDRAGLAYRLAYTSEHTAGQEAAVTADLALAPLPRALMRPPLRRLDGEADLPPIGTYRIELLRASNTGEAAEVLARHVLDRLANLPRRA
ncbi:LysR substrate-binding domain-containing protein [Arhodomonas sp. SL1]|uniref:LysR substrate-binding domain-containing protein n=1 Tax=Arhodomonas sp. SL1 TaxID=3425691 RepID=UPI003F885E56